MAELGLRVKKVFEYIDSFAPFESCESWDNSGILAGSAQNKVTGICCALDLSERVIDEALTLGANLIVTHHPIMFSGRKNLREDDAEGRMLTRLVRRNLNLISAHTNFDKAVGGVNDMLAEKLGLSDLRTSEMDSEGYLRFGLIDPMTLKEFTAHVSQKLGDVVRAYGEKAKLIRSVAVCGGAGGEFARLAQQGGADAYVTGEMRYHDSLDLAQEGFATLHCGHDATERLAIDKLAEVLRECIKTDGYDTSVVISNAGGFSINAVQ